MQPNDQASSNGPIWTVVACVTVVVVGTQISWHKVNWDRTLDFTTALRWPLIALWAIYLLKDKVPGLFDRIEKIRLGKDGVFEMSVASAQQQEASSDPVDEQPREQDPPNGISTPVEDLRPILEKVKQELHFEKAYRAMFGTQLEILQRLSSLPAGLAPYDLLDLFNKHKQLGGSTSSYPDLTGLMSYLIKMGFVAVTDTNAYIATPQGEEFLAYLAEYKMSLVNKPL